MKFNCVDTNSPETMLQPIKQIQLLSDLNLKPIRISDHVPNTSLILTSNFGTTPASLAISYTNPNAGLVLISLILKE